MVIYTSNRGHADSAPVVILRVVGNVEPIIVIITSRLFAVFARIISARGLVDMVQILVETSLARILFVLYLRIPLLLGIRLHL